MQNNRETGNLGEGYAKEYLINNGYNILSTNYRCKLGEIDIIVKKENYIIFIEVKYRKTLSYGYPREAVNYKKQCKIRKVASMYINTHNISNSDFRFDVIEILNTNNKNTIEHIKNAF